jgi:hypothetical protein
MRSCVVLILTLTIIVLNPRISVAKKVYSPHVEKGEVELETQTDVAFDPDPAKDGKIRQQFEIATGLTEWWQSGVYAVYEKQAGHSEFKYSAVKWENIFVLPNQDKLPLQWGLYAEYLRAAPARSAADAFEGKLLIEGEITNWKHILNLTLKQTLSSTTTAAEFGYAWRSQVEFAGMELAVEAYGALGPVDRFLPPASQSHLIGPVITFEPLEYVEIEAGWLMDVNAGPGYGDLKINVEIEF